MGYRAIVPPLMGLLLSGPVVDAQTPVQMPGAATPGPATSRPPRPVMPPRDGAGPAVAAGTGRIRGRVVAAETGHPLSRAQVRVSASQSGLIQGANTDSDGRYEFVKLPASLYLITVSRAGYVTLQFGQQRPFEPGKPFNLAEGEVAEKIDFALPRGGVIAGRLTDDTGEPQAGVRVQAQRYQFMPGGQRRLVTSGMINPFGGIVTDDLGQFRLYGLMPGSYVVSAMPAANGTIVMATPTGVTTSTSRTSGPENNDGFSTTYFPGTANVDEAQAITVELGQEAGAYFSLVSAPMARISGVIRNSQGSRLAGRVMVSLRTLTAGGGLNTNGMSTIGADGSFSITNVPPGEHFIDVRPMPAGPPAPGTLLQPIEEEFASVPVTVSGQDINGLVITTGAGATVSGRLIFDGNSPRPQTPQPLRVYVSAADPASPPLMMMANAQDNGVADEAGRFQIRGVNGQVLFRLGLQGWSLKSVTLNGVDITDTPLDAKPSTNVTGLEITLTDRQTNLSGLVRNSRGDQVNDFVVAVFPAALRDGMIATRFTRAIRPDQEGRYQAKGLPPGDYVAVAVDSLEQGGEWDPTFQQHAKTRGRTFRLNDGQLMALDLVLAQ